MTLITAQDYTLIQYSDIHGIAPDEFIDSIQLDEVRPVRIGVHKESFMTAEKHRISYDFSENYRQRLIQAVVYDKYRLEYLKTESNNAELMEFADSLTIYNHSTQKTYHAVIIEFTTDKVPGTTFDKVMIEFYDRNPENYFNQQPVVNVLRHDHLTERKSTAVLNWAGFYNVDTSTWSKYYTALYSTEMESDPENVKEIELNGYKKRFRSVTKKKHEIVLYLTDADLRTFKQRMYRAGDVTTTDNGHLCAIGEGGTVRYSYETPEIESEKISGAIDLNKVTFRVIASITNNFKYT